MNEDPRLTELRVRIYKPIEKRSINTAADLLEIAQSAIEGDPLLAATIESEHEAGILILAQIGVCKPYWNIEEVDLSDEIKDKIFLRKFEVEEVDNSFLVPIDTSGIQMALNEFNEVFYDQEINEDRLVVADDGSDSADSNVWAINYYDYIDYSSQFLVDEDTEEY